MKGYMHSFSHSLRVQGSSSPSTLEVSSLEIHWSCPHVSVNTHITLRMPRRESELITVPTSHRAPTCANHCANCFTGIAILNAY